MSDTLEIDIKFSDDVDFDTKLVEELNAYFSDKTNENLQGFFMSKLSNEQGNWQIDLYEYACVFRDDLLYAHWIAYALSSGTVELTFMSWSSSSMYGYIITPGKIKHYEYEFIPKTHIQTYKIKSPPFDLS